MLLTPFDISDASGTDVFKHWEGSKYVGHDFTTIGQVRFTPCACLLLDIISPDEKGNT